MIPIETKIRTLQQESTYKILIQSPIYLINEVTTYSSLCRTLVINIDIVWVPSISSHDQEFALVLTIDIRVIKRKKCIGDKLIIGQRIFNLSANILYEYFDNFIKNWKLLRKDPKLNGLYIYIFIDLYFYVTSF